MNFERKLVKKKALTFILVLFLAGSFSISFVYAAEGNKTALLKIDGIT